MRIAEFFCGLKGWSRAGELRGHDVWTTDREHSFGPSLAEDVLKITPDMLPWKPDVVLTSPPCEGFTVMQIGRHWHGAEKNHEPKTDFARLSVKLVEHMLWLIDELQVPFWVMENPVAKLRVLPVMEGRRRWLHPKAKKETSPSVTYCTLGELWKKPTDLWGVFPDELELPPPCDTSKRPVTIITRDGRDWVMDETTKKPCHVHAPAGSSKGIQSKLSPAERAKVPYALSLAMTLACEKALDDPLKNTPVQESDPRVQLSLM